MTPGGEAMDLHQIVDLCVERMIAGETAPQVLASYPERRAELQPAIEAAAKMLGVAVPEADAAVRTQAMGRMMAQLRAAPANGSGLGFRRFFMAFRTRPWIFKAASLSGAVLLFGVATLGAAAATGNTPQPVRSLFGLSSSSISVEFTGTVVSNDGTTLVVEINERAAASTATSDSPATPVSVTDERTVIIGTGTVLSRGDAAVSPADIVPGTVAEVKGSLQPDNTILASRIQVEHEDENTTPTSAGGAATDTPNADATSTPPTGATAVVPTATERDDNDADENGGCDSSGPGNPCEDNERGTAAAGDDGHGDIRGAATPSVPGASPTVGTDNSGPGSIDGGGGDDGDRNATAPAGTATSGDDHGSDSHDGSGDSGSGSDGGSGGSGPN